MCFVLRDTHLQIAIIQPSIGGLDWWLTGLERMSLLKVDAQPPPAGPWREADDMGPKQNTFHVKAVKGFRFGLLLISAAEKPFRPTHPLLTSCGVASK